MYKDESAKRAYFRDRYRKNKDMYKNIQSNYWINYAKKRLGKNEVTDEEVRQCKNLYYKEYRKNNPDIIKKNLEDCYARKTKKGE